MDQYHVIPAFHAKDALAKLQAANVDLAIVDMQIGSGGIWSENQTQDFKATGCRLCQEICLWFAARQADARTHQMVCRD